MSSPQRPAVLGGIYSNFYSNICKIKAQAGHTLRLAAECMATAPRDWRKLRRRGVRIVPPLRCGECELTLHRISEAAFNPEARIAFGEPVQLWACGGCSCFEVHPTARLSVSSRWCECCRKLSRSFTATLVRESTYLRPGKLCVELSCDECGATETAHCYLPLLSYEVIASHEERKEPLVDRRVNS